jgi:hypothetical protein
MDVVLSSKNFTSATPAQKQELESSLQSILRSDYKNNLYSMLADYQRILADNTQRKQWPLLHEKLKTLFMCGKAEPLNGPMIGVPVAIRDSDYFQDAAKLFGKKRSMQASLEVLATAWNSTLADTGLWMGKTFEPVSKAVVREKCDNDPGTMADFNTDTTRIGRNFFRDVPGPTGLQRVSLPLLEKAWSLKDRPMTVDASGFDSELLAENIDKEKFIPYSKTGGIYIANMGHSIDPEMQNKQVYQLNYRWPNLNPAYPMTVLIDEIVKLGEGVYLGQLVYATKHYSLGAIDLPFIPGERDIELGDPYEPKKQSFWQWLISLFTGKSKHTPPDYGYQNNGYFLMLDPTYAEKIYADDAFPQLRPRAGESGFKELGYPEPLSDTSQTTEDRDWVNGWKEDDELAHKFTSLITETSTQSTDDAKSLLQTGESVLQMLQRISNDISAQTKHEDHLKHFEQLHQLFRSGVAPVVKDGLFQGSGKKGYNTRIDGSELFDWYGEKQTIKGCDNYHGAALNLHWGFSETFLPDREANDEDASLIPGVLSSFFSEETFRGPNLLNMTWHSIGKYIFPWAGKTFEKISPRKLSMLMDESADLKQRYPSRVRELKYHLASRPHYLLVKKNSKHYWKASSQFTEHTASGSWDDGMNEDDRKFWQELANESCVMGYNTIDKRMLIVDPLMRIADMNYRVPDPVLQQASEESGSPFVRQGYCFLGMANQDSLLPMNNSNLGNKRVFQFHYRFPMIGGPVPIGYCLDELVEIADGLFLGQLIYSTALDVPFHSSVDSKEYKYQLFGYFLLLDDDWEHHRQAIKLDTV